MFRYRNRNSGQIVSSSDRRRDLEQLARWDAVEGDVTPAEVEVTVTEGEHILSAETVAEVEEAPKKPARRTRAKKTETTEVED